MDQSGVPYLDALIRHAEAEPARLYIPGHKGGAAADPALVAAIGPQALRMDIPALIPGIDVGPPEVNKFEQAQRLAADAWGAGRSWFLVGGASQGNHAACLTLRQRGGRRIILQRNAHSSAIDGCIVAGLEPVFVAPEIDGELGIAHCVTPATLEAALDAAPDAVGVLCVSPTYFGSCADVAALARVAHEHGVPLVIDEAWGAHMHFSPELPPSALESGADLVISSTHKIVGSLTQSAMIHVARDGLIPGEAVDRVVTLLESTSPSSLLGASLDAARRLAATRGEELLADALAVLSDTRARIDAIPGLAVIDPLAGGTDGVAGWDPLRLAVDVRGIAITGHRFAELLREREGVFVELATDTVIVAAFGMGGDHAALAERFVTAVERVAGGIGGEGGASGGPFAVPPPWGPLEMTPREAFLGPQEPVPFSEAAGRIAAESLAAYPPGIPNVLPGERLTQETLEFIANTIAGGGHLRGATDRTLKTIRVVVE